MVLAAGLGTRMRPLTERLAKPALPVLNRPLLHWTLDLLARHGVRDVMVNTHYRPGSVRRAAIYGRRLGLRLSFSHERRILGTGGGPRRVRSFFGDEPCLLVNGDVVCDFDLSRLLRRHRESGARATLALLPNPDPGRYGPIVTDRRGRVLSLVGRPRRARGTVSLFASVHVLEPALLERLPPGPSDTVRDLYPRLVAEGDLVLGVRVKGPWYDFGAPPLYLTSQLALLRKGLGGARRGVLVDPSARIASDAVLRGTVVGPDVRIGAGARVERCVLWRGARVGEAAVVRRSILTEAARVEPGERLEDRILTRRRGGTGRASLVSN